MGELKRSFSKRVKSTLTLSNRNNKQVPSEFDYDLKMITPCHTSEDNGIQSMKYDEIDPISTTATATSPAPAPVTGRVRSSTTSLPALLKRSKSLLSNSNNNNNNSANATNNSTASASRNNSAVSGTSIFNFASSSGVVSKRQSLSSISGSILTPLANPITANATASAAAVNPISANSTSTASARDSVSHHHQSILQSTNSIHAELIRALTMDDVPNKQSTIASDNKLKINTSLPNNNNNNNNDSKLDLLPPIPLKSPASEDQLSPTLPSRLTTPILEQEPFFAFQQPPQQSMSTSSYSDSPKPHSRANSQELGFAFGYGCGSGRPMLSRSRHNSSATSFSSHTTSNYPKTPLTMSDNNTYNSNASHSLFLNYLNDPMSNSGKLGQATNSANVGASGYASYGETEEYSDSDADDMFCDMMAFSILDKVGSANDNGNPQARVNRKRVDLSQAQNQAQGMDYFGFNKKTNWCI